MPDWTRVTARATAALVSAAVVAAAAVGGLGMLAAAVYLALRAQYSAPWAAGCVGAGLLAIAVVLVLVLWRGGRFRAKASSGAAREAVPPLWQWIEREPLAAGVLALALGFGAGRNRVVRTLLRELLREWSGRQP